MQRRALVAGATGLVGRALVQCLLDDPDTLEVVAVTRRPLAIPHPKLTEALVDFAHLQDIASPPVDDYYCCLGTTLRQAGSQEAFRTVDLVYPVTLAHVALAAGATRCFFVSAMGANAAAGVFYSRVKGELENELASLGYDTIVIARPSMLAGDRESLGQPVRRQPVVGVPPAALGPPGQVDNLADAGALAHQGEALGERRVVGRGGEERLPVARPALQEVLPVCGGGEGVVEVEHGQGARGAVGHAPTVGEAGAAGGIPAARGR